MLLNELLSGERDYITRKEIEEIETLISNALYAMDKISDLVGECEFGCGLDDEEDENHFSIWAYNAYWSFKIVD